ncbi:MAG: methyltransferase family protein [Sciscionella sp.]
MTARAGISLALRNLAFPIVVPGAGGVYVPWLILTATGPAPAPVAWYALIITSLGALLYLRCLYSFATNGHGTPGLWDAPRVVVATGPYRCVRNPIYLSTLLIVSGGAWLFQSPRLLAYTAALAVAFHLFVIDYEEPHLSTKFGEPYQNYTRAVSRWIPHRPRVVR